MRRKGGRAVHPDKIAHFEILEPLGSGAMGVVYRARDTVLKREVALKLIRPELTEDPRTRGRFIRECQAAASINHPGIATIYEAGQTEDGQLFFASELVAGESLQEQIIRGPLSSDRVLEIGVGLGRALAAAHARGIVHRDIKPGNLMVQSDGTVKILDFGLARLVAPQLDEGADADSMETMTQTRVGVVVGTPAYMSPEQAAGSTVDARADIFSCGSVLYAAASGKDAFVTGSVPETLRRILAEDPPPLESIDPSIPAGLRGVIRRAMAKDPESRYETADGLAVALEAVQRGEIPEPLPVAKLTARRGSRIARAAIGIVGALAIAILAIVGWTALRPGLTFVSRDKLLIADVDNQTPDAAFDLALRTALEADLQQSRYAGVFGQGQVAETLRLMRKDPGTRIDEPLGRDICRFAGVRALLVPRVLAVGEAYELQVILVDPVTGAHVDRMRVTARGREEVLLKAIDELTRQVRTRLGESLESVEQADEPVIQVTTSSWEALNYLALGNAKWHEAKYRDAAAMYELALEKDPMFVSAKGSLALLLIQFLGDPDRGRGLLAESLSEAEGLPEREYLMIKAVNRQFVDADLEGALEEYALISALYPDMMQPYNNRGRILAALRRFQEAVDMYTEAHRLDPTNSVPLANLYFLNIQYVRDASAAEAAARRLVELGPSIANFRSMLGWSLVAQGRFDDGIVELKRVLEDEPRHDYALPNAAHTLYAIGAADEAIPLYRRQLDRIIQGDVDASQPASVRDLALALTAEGRIEEAEELVEGELSRLDEVDESTDRANDLLKRAQLVAAVGRNAEAREYIGDATATGIEGAWNRLLLAQAYALVGEDELAIAELEGAWSDGYGDPYFPLVMSPFRGLIRDPRFLQLFGIEGNRN
jgi:tetratricopeptide (TPR) repeat protein/tRNA A-37 threonylcarbamoyl transferase component Bud32